MPLQNIMHYYKYPEKLHVNTIFFINILQEQQIKNNRKKEKDNYDLIIPENILSRRRHRKLIILICLNPNNINSMHKNRIFCNHNHCLS